MSNEERFIEFVAEQLKRPVQPAPDAPARVMEAIRRDEQKGEGEPVLEGPGLWRRYRAPLMAAAAIAFILLLSLQVWRSSVETAADSGQPVAVREPATRPVQFVFVAGEAARVNVVGDFNDWDPDATPLLREGRDVWSVVVPLSPGRYRYSFLVNGRTWVADASSPRAPVDEFGVPSSVIWVEAGRS